MRSDRFEEMSIFAKTVEKGGFSKAARALRLTPSAVSKSIARLEQRLKVRLFVRSTRSFALTAEGEAFHCKCLEILTLIGEAERLVAPPATPRGLVRVNAPVPIGTQFIVPLLPRFLDRYPEVDVDLTFSDTLADLRGEAVDVALRAGPLADSSLTVRKFLDSRRMIVGSPAYLARRGTPTTPRDLARHNCLAFNFRRAVEGWPLKSARSVKRMTVRGSVTAADGETLRALALAGVGLARLAEFHVHRDVAEGRLVPVLESCNPGDREAVHILFSGGDTMPSRVRAFIDFLSEHNDYSHSIVPGGFDV